jgi:DNA repair photolyase
MFFFFAYSKMLMANQSFQAHPGARRGRGALSQHSGRFETDVRIPLDDGWGNLDAPAPPLRTMVGIDRSRTIITRNKSPDVPFDRSVNAYRGCEHGCIYCFARPTHAYLGLSPGLDFESRLFQKPDAPAQLAAELAKPGYVPDILAMGTNTDPYQPIERKLELTRRILQVLADHKHPVRIVTKSNLVVRDADILGPMAEKGLADVFISVTTLDRSLARKMEPRAPTPERRLDAIRALTDAGIPTGVSVAPIIPGLTDTELEEILARAAGAGARDAAYVSLRLPLEIKKLFTEWLNEAVPNRAERVLNRLRGLHGGKLYDSRFGRRGRGRGAESELLKQRFDLATKRLGLNPQRLPLDVSRFCVPTAPTGQLSLF